LFPICITATLASYSQTPVRLCTGISGINHSTLFRLQVSIPSKPALLEIQFTAHDTCFSIPYHVNTRYTCRLSGGDAFWEPQVFNTDTVMPGNTVSFFFKPVVKQLQMATVKNNQPYFKGDTLIIPTDSIKTRPHAAATELLNKIPGMDAGTNGNISINGKKVEEITVNGQSLFGGNAKATLDAIKSSMVQQLEVTEKENSNGQTRAYLNLKLKKNRDRGWYGSGEQHVGNEQTLKSDVRLNHISPGRFVNIFANSNNLNEKALSEQNLFSFTNIFKREISAYSIMAQQMQGAISVTAGDDNFFANDFRDFGLNKNHSIGFSASNSSKKTETNAFMIGEKAGQNLNQTGIARSYFATSYRLDSSNSLQERERSSIMGNLTHQVRFNERNTLKTGLSLFYTSDNTEYGQQQQNNLFTKEGELLSQNTVLKNDNHDTRRFAVIHQASWLHRYRKPAKIFSLYARLKYQQNQSDHWYYNLLPPTSPQPGNNHFVMAERKYIQAEIEGIQSFPLSRKLLLEFQAANYFENARIYQQAWAFLPAQNKYSQWLQGISAMPIELNTHRINTTANVLYKTIYTSVIAGFGVSHWVSTRKQNHLLITNPTALKLLPYLALKKKFKKMGNMLVARYKAAWVDPLETQLNPLEDSSSVQQVASGNLYLESVLRHSGTVGFTRNVSIGQIFSASIQYGYIKNPVVNSSVFLPAPAIKNGFTQYGRQQQLTGSLFWLDYKSDRALSYFTSVVAGWQQTYSLNNNIPFLYNSFLGSFYLGGRYKVTRKMEMDLRLQAIYNTYLSIQEKSQGDLRGSVKLRIENTFSNEFYTIITTDLQVNGSNNPEQKISPFLSAEISKYFSRENKWRIIAGVKNLLNINNSFTFTQNNTQQVMNRFNNLPRVFTLGITYYFEKWFRDSNSK
jgi:hypothetical protein